MKPFTLGVPQDPLRQTMCGALMMVDHAPIPMERNGVEAIAIIDLARQSFGGLNKHTARVAIAYVESTQYLTLSSAVSSTSIRCLLYGPLIYMKKEPDTLAGYLLSIDNYFWSNCS